jgi:hypothetical protein
MPTIEEAAQREAERHCAIMPVGLYEFMDMMHRINGDGYVCMLAPGLPFGAKLIGASFDFSRNAFLLKWLHPSFPRVIEGAELPYLKPAQIHVVDVPKSRIAQLMEKMETTGDGDPIVITKEMAGDPRVMELQRSIISDAMAQRATAAFIEAFC